MRGALIGKGPYHRGALFCGALGGGPSEGGPSEPGLDVGESGIATLELSLGWELQQGTPRQRQVTRLGLRYLQTSPTH